MRKIAIALMLLASVSFATDADYFRVNTGAKKGSFNRTLTPVSSLVTVVGISQPVTTNMENNTGFIYMKGVSPNTELAYITKDASGNITIGTFASN